MEKDERLKALTDKLEDGVKAVFESEQYKAYLKAMSKFHKAEEIVKTHSKEPAR